MDNLRNEKVLEAIRDRLEPYQLGRDEVLAEVSFMALARDDEWIKASDKLKALEMLMKFHKMYEERVSHSFDGNAADEIREMLGLGAETPERPGHIRELARRNGADLDVLENRWAKVAPIAMCRPDLSNSWAVFLGDLPDNARHHWHTLDLAMVEAAVREWHRGRGVSKSDFQGEWHRLAALDSLGHRRSPGFAPVRRGVSMTRTKQCLVGHPQGDWRP